jgi:hypothetical protein
MDEFVPERTAAYISQHDLHIGEMTVRETLEFSARCQGVGTRFGMTLKISHKGLLLADFAGLACLIHVFIKFVLSWQICWLSFQGGRRREISSLIPISMHS